MVVYNGTAYAYVKNLQGDIIAILDSAGTAVVRYTYDAWGAPTGTTGTMAATLGVLNPFRYRSYVFDEETGLYYLRSRFYSPNRCRFINSDTVLNTKTMFFTINQFTYTLNAPVKRIDMSGCESMDITYTDVAPFRYTYLSREMSAVEFRDFIGSMCDLSLEFYPKPTPPVVHALFLPMKFLKNYATSTDEALSQVDTAISMIVDAADTCHTLHVNDTTRIEAIAKDAAFVYTGYASVEVVLCLSIEDGHAMYLNFFDASHTLMGSSTELIFYDNATALHIANRWYTDAKENGSTPYTLLPEDRYFNTHRK